MGVSRPPVGCDCASGESDAGRSAVGVRGGSGGTAGSNVSAVATLLCSRADGPSSSDCTAGSGTLPLALATGDTVTWGAGAATTRGSESSRGSAGVGEVMLVLRSSSPAMSLATSKIAGSVVSILRVVV